MGRKSTGTVRLLRNGQGDWQWHARWTRDDRTRTDWLPLDPNFIAVALARFRERTLQGGE
jgi:hypothetical protein